jgi:hypothetical protein
MLFGAAPAGAGHGGGGTEHTFNFRIDVQDGASTSQPDMYGIMVGSYRSGEHVPGGGNVDIHKN